MKSKMIHQGAQKTFALIFEKGEEVVQELTGFAKQQNLDASQLTAVGAFQSAVLGFFERETKQYKKIPVDEQVEVLSLLGDIALSRGEPKVHAHVVLGKADGTACGRASARSSRLADSRSGADRIVLAPSPQARRRDGTGFDRYIRR